MNVFYLDTDPKQSAIYHCDAHLRKMIVEYAQILCIAHWQSKDEIDLQRAIEEKFYKPTHVNHPSTQWTIHSPYSYAYVYTMWEELLLMYVERYGKTHGSMRLRDGLQHLPRNLHDDTRTYMGEINEIHTKMPPPPMCFGREFEHIKKDRDPTKHVDVVEAYRDYYRQAKHKVATWGGDREVPRWWLRIVA